MPLKPRKLDRSARLPPVLQITAVARPLSEPSHAVDTTRHMVTAPAPTAQPDAEDQPATDQQVLRPAVSEPAAQMPMFPMDPLADGSSRSSPGQLAAAEAAQQAGLWVPLPAPRIVAVLRELQARRHDAVEHEPFCQWDLRNSVA